MTLIPMLDWLIVRMHPPVGAAGIKLYSAPDPFAPRKAEVIAVGPGRPSEYTGVTIYGDPAWTVGSTLLVPGGSGHAKVMDGETEYRFLKPGDILAVVPPTDSDATGTADLKAA